MTAGYAAVWNGPLGRFGIAVADDYVTRIDRLAPGPDQAADHPLAAEAVRQLAAWFADPRHVFELPLAPAPTPFQRRLREAVCAVPVGELATYGEIARRLASAPRAVGGACAAGRISIVVPYHRIVAANGIGGYGRGDDDEAVAFKRQLIAWEWVAVGIDAPVP